MTDCKIQRKTDEQKIEELQKKLDQLKVRKKELEIKAKQKEKYDFIRENMATSERRERTHRLIQIGALSEKYFNCSNIEPKGYENILKSLIQIEQVKETIRQREQA